MLPSNLETATPSAPFETTENLDYVDYKPARKRLDSLKTIEDITYNPIAEKIAKKRRIINKISTFAIAASTLFSAYVADTNSNIEKEQRANLSIEVVAPALNEENNDTAILFFDGFNANRAEYLSSILGPGMQSEFDGEIWAANFNNDPANREKIIEKANEKVEERGIKNLFVIGYSKGGINGSQLGVDTVINTWTDVDAMLLMSTPSSYDGLRPYQQKELEAGIALSKLWRVRYSTPVRFIGEVYFYRDQFMQGGFNIKNFFDVLGQVQERFESSDLTTTSFLIEQIDDIDKANFPNEFGKLSESAPTKQMPVIVYLGTAEPAFDVIVDDKKSGDEICEAAEQNNLTCIRDEVESYHSLYFQSVDKFNETYARIGEKLRLAISKEQARVAITRFDYARKENR